jgi:hypothetical protein
MALHKADDQERRSGHTSSEHPVLVEIHEAAAAAGFAHAIPT